MFPIFAARSSTQPRLVLAIEYFSIYQPERAKKKGQSFEIVAEIEKLSRILKRRQENWNF